MTFSNWLVVVEWYGRCSLAAAASVSWAALEVATAAVVPVRLVSILGCNPLVSGRTRSVGPLQSGVVLSAKLRLMFAVMLPKASSDSLLKKKPSGWALSMGKNEHEHQSVVSGNYSLVGQKVEGMNSQRVRTEACISLWVENTGFSSEELIWKQGQANCWMDLGGILLALKCDVWLLFRGC